MKKTKKLELRRETVRALSEHVLLHVVGGSVAAQCVIAFGTGDKECEAPRVEIATTARG